MSNKRNRDLILDSKFKEALESFDVKIYYFEDPAINLPAFLKKLKLHKFHIINEIPYWIENRKLDNSKYYIRINYDGVREDVNLYLKIVSRDNKISNLLERD